MPWSRISGRKSGAGTQSLAERLGYGASERLLIVHADDLGIAHAVNAAFMSGLATGLITSGSVIVPGKSLPEIAAFAQRHPEADIGLHLTLTNDSASQPWTPAASPSQIPSLVDQRGIFFEQWTSTTRANPREVEIELRAQIEKAYASGIHPTHLDSHRFRLQLSGKEIFEVYLRMGREYRLPVLVPRQWFSRLPYLESSLVDGDAAVDRMIIINGQVTPERWPDFYRRALENLPPGVSEILLHPGYDTEELQQFFDRHLPWGAAWRQRDYDFFTSEVFRDLLSRNKIKLITWRDIKERLRVRSPLARMKRMFGSL